MTEPVIVVDAADVPSTPPDAGHPALSDVIDGAVMDLVKNLGKRAFHTFWQTFLATLATLWATSGVDIHSVTDLSGAVKAVIPLIAAALAAGFSAGKTVVADYLSAKKSVSAP